MGNQSHKIQVLQVVDNIRINNGISTALLEWNRYLHPKVTFDFLVCNKEPISYEDEIKKMGGNVFYLSEGHCNYITIAKKARDFFAKEHGNYDMMHLHTGTYAYPFLYYAKKYSIKKRIVHAHSARLGNTTIRSLRNKLFVFPIRFWATDFIACSELAAKEWFRKMGIKQYTVLHNGMQINRYKYDEKRRRDVRSKLLIEDNEIALVHISNMAKTKNIPFLLKVFKELYIRDSKYRLFLIGKEDNDINPKYSKYITKNNLNNGVRNLGVIKNIEDVIQGMDICLMPSKSEGLGMVPLETQINGLHTIVSDGFPRDISVSDRIKQQKLIKKKWFNDIIKIDDFEKKHLTIKDKVYDFDIHNTSERLLEIYKTLYSETKSKTR